MIAISCYGWTNASRIHQLFYLSNDMINFEFFRAGELSMIYSRELSLELSFDLWSSYQLSITITQLVVNLQSSD